VNPARLDMILRLRQSGISDINVLRAMETIARTGFAPAHYSDMAYEERDLPIDCGQSLPAPLTVAVMAQALELKGDGKLLEIGSGSGYQAAVLFGHGRPKGKAGKPDEPACARRPAGLRDERHADCIRAGRRCARIFQSDARADRGREE